MKNNMLKLLVCPACRQELDFNFDKECFCKACSIKYRIQDEVVNFLPEDNEIPEIENIRPKSKIRSFIRKM